MSRVTRLSRLTPVLWSLVGFLVAPLLALGVGGCSGAPEQTASVVHASAVAAPSAPDEPFPLPVIELSGDGAALGAGHGKAMRERILELHDQYLERYFSNSVQRTVAMGVASMFESHIAPAHVAETRALAEASSVDYRQMLLAQCFLDLSPMTACSTVTLPADASPDGVGRFGRNLDFPSFNIADKYTVVLVVRPEGKHAFASIAWPGMVGVLSGMNEHGLAVSNMEVSRGTRLPVAMPYTLLYRSVLENCRTTEEAIAFLEKTPRQTANNLMVMDAAGERAVVEITPQRVRVRKGQESRALFSTNHQRDQDCDTAGRCDRYDSMHTAATKDFGKIDLAKLQSMLKEASQGNMTLQSMIFEPSTGVLYLSAGADAASKKFSRLNLKPLFEQQ